MYCSTSLTQLPLWPRLPRGLVGLLILSLLFQTILPPTFTSVLILPSLTLLPGRWRTIRSRVTYRLFRWRAMGSRLFVRMTLLAILLHLSGWATANALTWSVLAIPVAQTLITLSVLRCPTAIGSQKCWPWLSRLGLTLPSC